MSFLTGIIDACNNISSFFYSIYLEVRDWVFPFYVVDDFFYSLSLAFNTLAWQFYYFSQWVDSVSDSITSILSWNTIWSYILSYVPNLLEVSYWFSHWASEVSNLVTDWWDTQTGVVQSWIDSASQYLQGQLNNIDSLLNTLSGEWTNFKNNTLPSLPTLPTIEGLIDSYFVDFSPLWEGWQDVRNSVIEFISDPLQWLYDRIDAFFDRFW